MEGIKDLKDTVSLMLSSDYKDRFCAEFYQTKIRFKKLKEMCDKYEKGELNFTPTCDIEVYESQMEYMGGYLIVLADRAKTEGIELDLS